MKLSIKQVVSIGVYIGILLLTIILAGYDYFSYRISLYENAQKEMDNISRSLEDTLNEKLKDLSLSIHTVANDQEASRMLAEGDRQALEEKKFLGFYKGVKETHGIAQFQFHTPPAISFLRLHKPGKFGDDLSAFRQTVVDTNNQQKPMVGLEVGRGGPGLRAVYPMFYEGKHLGSVEYGGSINNSLANIKKTLSIWISLSGSKIPSSKKSETF